MRDGIWERRKFEKLKRKEKIDDVMWEMHVERGWETQKFKCVAT